MVQEYNHSWYKGKTINTGRMLMEQKLGRELCPNEEVHHKDGNKRNDSIENLEPILISKHRKLHGEDRRKISDDPNLAWCSACQTFLPKENFPLDRRYWNGRYYHCSKCRNNYERERYNRKKLRMGI